ncbi:penicillin acylase family protein [Pleionea sp. CnH1-48]|uniref:penicillin acylase family protein n=1 Tax=Pleionea sp. CnH1-48 TaxID=2954494 RepID=UPI0020975AF8|nr:penicillin acylase family protein [Pleionea sp. CnH1-48]MCO7226820.1 penicillin acylase family protein [Pleionea sp. CnH1-48]
MFIKYPLLTRTVLFVVIPLVILSGVIYNEFIVRPLPNEMSLYELKGISEDVRISRDEHGLVNIVANKDNDVYFAMGYLHAQDRLWQLEVQRRLSQGRLSEVFGRGSLDQDIWIRTLGIYQAAERSLELLSPEAKASLEAYSEGINTWLQHHSSLPIEFTLMGVEPEPWKPIDSLAWAKMFALDLGGNFRLELQRYIAAHYLSDREFSALFPSTDLSEIQRSSQVASAKNNLDHLLDIQEHLESELNIGGRYVGSNAWVVSGRLTQSGFPILANDPHLGLQIPSLWYAVTQRGASLQTEGMSLVGLPVVVFGKNQHIAWGGTSMMADVQDLFIEKVSPTDPERYWNNEQWLSFKTRVELIDVKADFPSGLRKALKPVEISVRESVNGPVVSDVVKGADQVVSLRWTALAANDTTYESFYRLSYADNWDSFKEAASYHVAPTLNLLYADTSNNIGFIGVGKIPQRAGWKGALPANGAEASQRWLGYIPFAEMPQIYNPKSGYLVSANNQNVSDDYPYFISQDWALPARAERIEELIKDALNSNKKFSLDDMAKMQADTKDLSVTHLRNYLALTKPQNIWQKQAIELLSQWDGFAHSDSIGASIFYNWSRNLNNQLFTDELKNYWNHSAHRIHLNSLISNVPSAAVLKILKSEDPLCNNIDTAVAETCEDIVQSALEATIKQYQKLVGNDAEDWKWAGIQNTRYSHTPFSNVKLLDSLFERKIPSGGAINTINVANSAFHKSDGYIQTFGAGFRQIMAFAKDNSSHIYMNSTGQSGQVGSSHYDDMVEPFRDVKFYPMKTPTKAESSYILSPKKLSGEAP